MLIPHRIQLQQPKKYFILSLFLYLYLFLPLGMYIHTALSPI